MICVFFFNDTATTEIYTLSLHDALPICRSIPDSYGCCHEVRRKSDLDSGFIHTWRRTQLQCSFGNRSFRGRRRQRSEEHTSELQSRQYLVCRLLLEKKTTHSYTTQPYPS